MVKDRTESEKKKKGERVVIYSLGRVTSGKLMCNQVNEVKLINDKIMTHTYTYIHILQ